MLPSLQEFKDQMKAVDVRKKDLIVVYDQIGNISAGRAVWLLRTFGLQNVLLLNGAFDKWQGEQRDIISGDVPTAWKRVR